MQTEIKIGIVEDELIIAEKIKRNLLNMGYQTCEPVGNYDEALQMIESDKPDMLLIDINLNDKKDGIDLAEIVNTKYHLPFIFLTANSDSATIERAKKVKPNAYIVKPFTKEELFAAIEIAFNNYTESKIRITADVSEQKNFLFIRDNHRFIKVMFDQIVSIESRENYVLINTTDKKTLIVRSTFSDFLQQCPADKFIRTHRCFAVQISLIENVSPTEVFTGANTIPVSNTYRQELYRILGIKL